MPSAMQHPLFIAKVWDGLLRNAALAVPKDVFEQMAATGNFDDAMRVLQKVGLGLCSGQWPQFIQKLCPC